MLYGNIKNNNSGLRLAGWGSRRKPTADNRKSKIAFTLVELLLVSAMLGIISLAIFATFNSGIKIWQRLNTTLPEEDLDIFFDKFGTDLRNSFGFKYMNFIGTADKIEFATLVNSSRLNKRTVGLVTYSYDPMTEVLDREEKDFSQIYNDEEGIITLSLKNVASLGFQYYFYDEERREYLWDDEWRKEKLPLAIRISLEFNDGTQTNKVTKTVSLPASG